MFEEVRCIFCNRSINKDQIMFRYPSNTTDTEYDFRYGCMLKAHGINPTGKTILPKTYKNPEEQQLNSNNGKSTLSVYLSDGTVLTDMICPTCHGKLFRDTDDVRRNTYLFFGEPDSGRTSLIYSIIGEGVLSKSAKEIFERRYIPFYNDYQITRKDLEKTCNDISNGKICKPENFKLPVVIHRAAAAGCNLENKTDVFLDVTDFHIKNGDYMDMTLEQAENAKAFVFTIPVTKLIMDDNVYYGRDVELRSRILPMYYSLKGAVSNPAVFVAITCSDLIYNGTFDPEISKVLDDYLNSPGDLFRVFFETRYPLTSDMLKRFFGNYNLCFTTSRNMESNKYVSELSGMLYKQLSCL